MQEKTTADVTESEQAGKQFVDLEAKIYELIRSGIREEVVKPSEVIEAIGLEPPQDIADRLLHLVDASINDIAIGVSLGLCENLERIKNGAKHAIQHLSALVEQIEEAKQGAIELRVPIRTAITATLSVRNGRDAITFYEQAFGAKVLHRVEDEAGTVVAQLSVLGAEFWVADESLEHQNYSPMTLGGSSVRMLLIVDDPQEVCRMARICGASQIVEVTEEHGWQIGRIVDPFGHRWEIAKPISQADQYDQARGPNLVSKCLE